MDLVNDYLRAVAALLPRTEREDIVEELRESILGRIEARETELGRPLTPDEIEATLRAFGHPLVVAARYRSETQHVVGPALYPFWLFVVKFAVLIQAVGALAVLITRWLSGLPFGLALGDAISAATTGAIMIVGIVTTAAWIIERFKVRLPYLENWRVRDLRIFEYADLDFETLKGRLHPEQQPGAPNTSTHRTHDRNNHARDLGRSIRRHRRSGAGTVAEGLTIIAWTTVFALWWAGALRFGVVGDIPDLDRLSLSPGLLAEVDWAALKAVLYWPVLALALLAIAKGVAMLANPRAKPVHGLFALVQGCATLALCAWLWTASPIAAAIQVDSLSELAVRVKTAFRESPPLELAPLITMILVFVALGAIGQMLKGLWLVVAPRGAGDEMSKAHPA